MTLHQHLSEIAAELANRPLWIGTDRLFQLERQLLSQPNEESQAAAVQLSAMILAGVNYDTKNPTEQLYLRIRRYSPTGARLAVPVTFTRPSQQRGMGARMPMSQ